MTMENYTFRQDKMEEFLSSQNTAKNDMTTINEQIMDIVSKKLFEHGFSGTTADAMLATFKREVVEPMEEFAESQVTNMEQNKKVAGLAEDTSAKNKQTATMV